MLRIYTIKNVSDITLEIIKDCVQTSMDTLRKNKTKTKAVLKWEGETPAWVGQVYTEDEMRIEMQKDEWGSDENN